MMIPVPCTMLGVLSSAVYPVLASVPLFARLPPELLHSLERHVETRLCQAGEVIFRQGDPGDALYVVQHGAVAIRLVSADGKELEIAKLSDGDIFGELAVLDGAPRSAQATAVGPTALARLLRVDLLRVARWHPQLNEVLLQVVAQRLRHDMQAACEVAFLDAPGRLASVLLRMSTAASPDGQLTPPLSQPELARMIGSTRETVNRCLARFEKVRAVRRDGACIAILDPEWLRRRAA